MTPCSWVTFDSMDRCIRMYFPLCSLPLLTSFPQWTWLVGTPVATHSVCCPASSKDMVVEACLCVSICSAPTPSWAAWHSLLGSCASLQVSLPGGHLRTVIAAARTVRVTKKERVAPPATTSPPPAATASLRPALPRRQSSVGPWHARPTSRLWTVPSRRAPSSWSSSQRCDGKVTCSGLWLPAPGSRTWVAKKKLLRKSCQLRKSWRNASRIS